MARWVWKQLPPAELAAFRSFLAGLPAGERPQYGLVGVQAWWWTRLGGGGRPLVVLFSGERVIVSKRSWRGRRTVSRREYRSRDLQRVSVRRGPFLDSARFWFADGYTVRVGALPRRQARPVESFLREGAAAFDPERLSPAQLTNTCLAREAMGLPVGDPEGAPPGPRRAGD